MTVQEVKQILREAREAGLNYIMLRDKARRYEQRIMCGKPVRYENDGGAHERDCNGMERSLCAAADYKAEADRAARSLAEPYRAAGKLIYLVKDDKLRDVLNRYYLCCQSWKRISKDTGISYRHITRLHEKALKKISEST